MKYRWQIFIGFAVVILPPLLSTLWTIHSSRTVNERVAHLNQPLFPILAGANDITFKINDLQEAFIIASLSNDQADIQKCRELVADLEERFHRLRGTTGRKEIIELYGLAQDYTQRGLRLLESTDSADVYNKGEVVKNSAQVLKAAISEFRDDITKEFSDNLDAVDETSDDTRFISWVTSTAAFLFGTLLAMILAHRFGLQDDALRRANEELATRYDELYRTNDLLEKQVAERKRAEEALRLSLNYEEALAEVSELFTATFSPNLRRAAAILGKAVGADISFIVIHTVNNAEIEQCVVWQRENLTLKSLDPDLRAYPEWISALTRNENLVLDRIGLLPNEMDPKQAMIHEAGIQSLLAVPITSDDENFRGYMGLATHAEVMSWTKEDIRILRVATEILANYLARKRAEERLKHDAFHDGLTNLANRSLFLDRLTHMLERADRNPETFFAVLLLDLDRFKPINDSLGHLTGDQLLIQVADRLEECVRNVDTVARLGGDEFTILLEEVNQSEEVEEIARRINEKLAEPFRLGSNSVHTSASIGITMCDSGYAKPEDILRDADIAMYQAKTQGKARYVIFDPQSHGHSTTILMLESDLRKAVSENELKLFYQPIVSFNTGMVVGFEALLRWRRGGNEWVPPARFIPLAEDSGLIRPIGRWAVQQACRQAKAWVSEGFEELTISVNVSPKQFYEENLVGYIQQQLNESGLAPEHLQIEITESLLMENIGVNIAMLEELREMGLQISVDDFGTGYSSLSYLKRFPIHTLKIDRSFVRDVPHDKDDTAITSAIIAMALSLNLKVIAEGVENLEQFDFLKVRGCQKFQGYLFSKPIPAEEATELLMKNKTLMLPGGRSGSLPAQSKAQN
ncbi:MAG: EAL domain-containing protein [Acidobacteriota bacterium]|nr:EAL domain-containing protein [Acidobacteriota bacterium]